MKAVLLALACAGAALVAPPPPARAQTPAPTPPPDVGPAPDPTYGGKVVPTPYDVAPVIVERSRVTSELIRQYPGYLRERGIGGTTVAWLLIDEQGRVLSARVHQTSGLMGLDAAALRVVSAMRFTPARLKGEPVRVWVALPVVFKVAAERPRRPGATQSSEEALQAALESRLPSPPFPPAGAWLLNGGHVRERLRALYAERFPDGKVRRGKVRLGIDVDADGNAVNAWVEGTSNNPSLDEIALAAAKFMVFVPAVGPLGVYVPDRTLVVLEFPPGKD